MPKGIVIGDDERVAAWAFSTFKRIPTPINRALGIVEQSDEPYKALIGAVLLQNYNGSNIELSYYGPRTLTPGIVRSVAKMVQAEFNPSRVTAVTSKKNKRLMRSLQKFGFRLEGVQRRYYGARDCYRNTGVRFVLFSEQIEKLAGDNPARQLQNRG